MLFRSQVFGHAQVFGDARIVDRRGVLTAGPLGSEGRIVTCHRTTTGHQVVAGCWSGTLDELAERIDSPDAWDHGTAEDRDRWRRDYTAAIALFAARVADWAETPQPPMPETEVAS